MTLTVLYIQDALRANNCSTYGYERKTTPNLSKIAEDGLRFTGITPTTWTKAAAASILTGCRPFVHQAYYRDSTFTAHPCTLPAVLPNDVKTVGLVANGHLSSEFGFDEGFDEYVEVYKSGEEWIAPPAELTDRLLSILENTDPEEDVFVLVWSIGPHLPYTSSPPRWGKQGIGETRGGIKGKIREYGREALVNRYDDQIRENDEHLGKLVNKLEEEDVYEETCLVVAGDHGEGFGEGFDSLGKKAFGHGKVVPYQEVIEVPLVLKPPNHCDQTDNQDASMASLIDIFPTICKVYDAEPPSLVQGQSLLSSRFERDRCFVQTPGADRQGDRYWAIRTLNWNFVKVENKHGPLEGIRCGMRAYIKSKFIINEMLLPIDETKERKTDVKDRHPDDVACLRSAIAETRSKDESIANSSHSTVADVSESTYENLKEMGYVE